MIHELDLTQRAIVRVTTLRSNYTCTFPYLQNDLRGIALPKKGQTLANIWFWVYCNFKGYTLTEKASISQKPLLCCGILAANSQIFIHCFHITVTFSDMLQTTIIKLKQGRKISRSL